MATEEAKVADTDADLQTGDQNLTTEDGKQDPISLGSAQTGNTATGQELRRRAGQEEIPSGEDRGSTSTDTSDIKPDFLHQGEFTPTGQQAEPAAFAPNGSLQANMVPSNSGLVPISAVTGSPEEAQKRLESHKKQVDAFHRHRFAQRNKLTDSQIAQMGSAELRAVAHDRGYEFSDLMGARGTRSAFKKAQDEDEFFTKQDEKADNAGLDT